MLTNQVEQTLPLIFTDRCQYARLLGVLFSQTGVIATTPYSLKVIIIQVLFVGERIPPLPFGQLMVLNNLSLPKNNLQMQRPILHE